MSQPQYSMEKALYKAAVNGDTGFLKDTRDREIETGYWDEYLLSKTLQNNNILHIASLHGKLDFIQNMLTMLNFSPLKLISEQNINGKTPLHIASKKGNLGILKLLVHYCKLNSGGGEEVASGGDYELTWRVRNSEGNTPLHEAILHGRTEVARYLIELDDEVTGFVNNRQETPLHLAVQRNAKGNFTILECCFYDDKQLVMDTIELINKQHASLTNKASKCQTQEESLSMIQLLLQKNSAPLYMVDEDGLTPLLRAANVSNVSAMQAIVTDFPETTEVCDCEGRTILHLVKIQKYEDGKTLMNIPEIVCLKDEQDYLGNTPALVAVKDIISLKKTKELKDNITEQQWQNSCEFGMVKALLASSADFTIKNKDGISAATLIQQHKTSFSNMGKYPIDEDLKLKADSKPSSSIILQQVYMIRDAIENANLDYLINNVSVNHLGNDLTYYGCLGGGNVLHGVLKAWKSKFVEPKNYNLKDDDLLLIFVEKVLERFPILLCEGDYNGDTPLHIIVRDFEITQSFLDNIIKYFEKSQQELGSDEELYCTPWKMKNLEGNTPLHEALLNSPSIDKIVSHLIHIDTSMFAIVNSRDETPLHVLCRLNTPNDKVNREKFKQVTPEVLNAHTCAAYKRDVEGLIPLLRAAQCGNIYQVKIICEISILEMEKLEDVTRLVLEAYVSAAYKRDVEGLTPVLRAAQSGNIIQLETICEICPQSAQLKDNNGRTFWHVIDISKVSRKKETYSVSKLLKDNEQIKNLLHVKDDEGNTSVKRAIETRNYHLLKALRHYKDVYGEVEDILKKADFETRLLLPTIEYANLLPRKHEQILWKILERVPETSYMGVQESEISGYSQTLGVVAVLLATIAFTAAFTVPGGFRQQHEYLNNKHTSVPFNISPSGAPDNPNGTSDLIGTPVILGTDSMPFLITAAYWVFMVSDIISMCLSAFVIYCLLWITNSREMRMILIDISIFTIRICFYTTMIAFMMGVFVTTLRVEPWLAYFTVVFCSLVMCVLNRWLFPVKTILFTFVLGQEVVFQALESELGI